jgi:hypothetical protein
MCCGCECAGPKRACARCRGCVHRLAPVMKALSLVSGSLMAVGGALGAVSLNPFTLLHGFFLALLGLCVIGGEFSWAFVLRRAPFLASYGGKGMFFLYIALPLVEEGWAEYKNCVLWWRDLPCPTTPADPDPPGEWLARLLTQSVLVQFAVGLALTVAGVLKLLFAATGPPPRDPADGQGGPDDDDSQHQPTLQSRRGSEALIEPLVGGGEKRALYSDVETARAGAAAAAAAALLPPPSVHANALSLDESIGVPAGSETTAPIAAAAAAGGTAPEAAAAAATAAAASAQQEVARLQAEVASLRLAQQAAAEASAAEAASASATGTTYAQQQRQALLANLKT